MVLPFSEMGSSEKERNGREGTGFPGHAEFGETKIRGSACVQINKSEVQGRGQS